MVYITEHNIWPSQRSHDLFKVVSQNIQEKNTRVCMVGVISCVVLFNLFRNAFEISININLTLRPIRQSSDQNIHIYI